MAVISIFFANMMVSRSLTSSQLHFPPKVFKCSVSVIIGFKFNFDFTLLVMWLRWLPLSNNIRTCDDFQLSSLKAILGFVLWRRTVPLFVTVFVVVVLLISPSGWLLFFPLRSQGESVRQIDWWWPRCLQWRQTFSFWHELAIWPGAKHFKLLHSFIKISLRWTRFWTFFTRGRIIQFLAINTSRNILPAILLGKQCACGRDWRFSSRRLAVVFTCFYLLAGFSSFHFVFLNR